MKGRRLKFCAIPPTNKADTWLYTMSETSRIINDHVETVNTNWNNRVDHTL
jgi:hypothetical protein